jgi:hypothetical protein
MCLGGKLHGHCCNKKADIIKADVIVPLTGATATVTIVDFVAQVVIKQRYENKVPLCSVPFRSKQIKQSSSQ